MKIAFVYDAVYPYVKGGAEKRYWEAAKRLINKGHEVHIYGIKWWDGEKDIVEDGVHLHGVCKKMEFYTGKEGQRSIKQALFFAFYVLVALLKEKEKFDIVDCCNFPYLSAFPVKFYCFVKKIPMIITWHEVWDRYWYEYLGLFNGFIGKLIERTAARFPYKIISVSDTTRSELMNIGVTESKIKVIPNGIDLNEIGKIKPSSEKCDVLFAGRLIKDKNVDVLIKSIGLVKKNIPGVLCFIIGEGPEKEKLVKLSEDLNLKDNIKFTGFAKNHDDVISYMKSAKIFALPSTREGFGLVILEACACGLPAIGVNSRNSRCVAEIIRDGENGFLLNDINEKIFAEKINLLLEDKDLRNKMSENGKKFSMNYDWDRITNEIEKLYLEVLK